VGFVCVSGPIFFFDSVFVFFLFVRTEFNHVTSNAMAMAGSCHTFHLATVGAQYPLRKECDDRKCDLFVLEVWEECVRCSPLIVPLLYEKRDIY